MKTPRPINLDLTIHEAKVLESLLLLALTKRAWRRGLGALTLSHMTKRVKAKLRSVLKRHEEFNRKIEELKRRSEDGKGNEGDTQKGTGSPAKGE